MWHLPDPDCFWGSESLDLRNSTKPLNQRQSLSETPSYEETGCVVPLPGAFPARLGGRGGAGRGRAAGNASGVKNKHRC